MTAQPHPQRKYDSSIYYIGESEIDAGANAISNLFKMGGLNKDQVTELNVALEQFRTASNHPIRTTTTAPSAGYVVDKDTFGAMGDYFESAIRGDESKMKLERLWRANLSVATSLPYTPAPATISGIGFTRKGFLKFLRWRGIEFEEEENGIYIRISGDSMYLKFDKIYAEHSPEHDNQIRQQAASEATLKTRKDTIEEIYQHVKLFSDPMTDEYLQSLRQHNGGNHD